MDFRVRIKIHIVKPLAVDYVAKGFYYFNEDLYSSPQFHMASRIGFRLLPKSVSEYSTLGGTSAYTLRLTRPFSSISRSWAVNTFWDTLPIDFFNSPKRLVP